MSVFKSVIALIALLCATSVSATVLDFESFTAGTIIDNEYFSSFGVTVSAAGIGTSPDYAVVFDSNNPTGNDDDLAAPFAPGVGNPFGSISPGNLLILQENDNCDGVSCATPDDQGVRPAGTMSFAFSDSVYLESIDFFDIEGTEPGTVVVYGLGGIVLNTLVIPTTGGDNLWQRMSFDIDGVTALDINMGGSGAIDNLTFVVPLPGGLTLMFGALGMLGLLRRRL